MTITTPTTPRPSGHASHDLNQAWCDAFNAGDLDELLTMYEPDAVLVPGPGAPPVRGLLAIEQALRALLAMGGTLRFVPRFWLVHDDLAMGSISFVMDGGHDPSGQPVDLRGVTAEVCRRQPDGRWRCLVDHPFGGTDQAGVGDVSPRSSGRPR